MYYFFLIFILLKKTKEQIIINKTYVENPLLYKNEICSYNGNPNIINQTHIECSCYTSYVDEPREDYQKYVGNQIVHCSYKKKKRFTTFFLAGLAPMGFDYYYLGHYLYFCIILFGFILLVISHIISFLLSYKLKEMYEESKYKYSDRNENYNRNNIRFKSNKKTNKKERLQKCLFIHRIINKIFCFIFLLYWIVDIIIQARGLVKDSNGIETEDDMNSLFSREET